MNTFKWILTVVMGALCVLIIGGSMHGCSHNPTAAVEPMPRTSEEGEQAFLNRMHKDGKALPDFYCWSWFDIDGHVNQRCRFEGQIVVGGQ